MIIRQGSGVIIFTISLGVVQPAWVAQHGQVNLNRRGRVKMKNSVKLLGALLIAFGLANCNYNKPAETAAPEAPAAEAPAAEAPAAEAPAAEAPAAEMPAAEAPAAEAPAAEAPAH